MKKILIIEGSKIEACSIENILSREGYKTYLSADVKDGIQIAARYLPDMVICCMNGSEEGYKLINTLNENQSTQTIPLFFLSDNFDVDQLKKVLELGADDYLAQPFKPESFLNLVRRRFNKIDLLKEKIAETLNRSFDDTESTVFKDHILVKIGLKLKFIKFNSIVVICAQKEYSEIQTSDKCRIIIRKSLKNWIDLLPSNSFLRIHRGTIINIEYMDRIVKTGIRSYSVYLKNIDKPFALSQRYANVMRKTFPT